MSTIASTGSQQVRINLATFIGTTLEWYDFFIYGAVAALVLNKLFFPNFDPATGTLLAFASFSVGFIARPVGAVIFGHYGDTLGRRGVLTATMLIMGVATFLIGILPTYDTMGVSATILLVALRFLQGIGLGGEWGGSVLMAAEHSHPDRRGLGTSWTQIGVPAGNLLSVSILTLLSWTLTSEQFLAWGWRIPFLGSAVLVIVGLFVRFSLTETPTFLKLRAGNELARNPIYDLVTTHRRSLLVACFARIGTDIAFYIFSLFILSYVTGRLGLGRELALMAVFAASAVQLLVIPVCAHLSDRYGRRPIFLIGAVGAALWMYPFFALLDTKQPAAVVASTVIAMTFWGLMYGPLAALIAELFSARVRYSGTSVGYQLAGIVGGGLAPLIAFDLLQRFNSTVPIVIYVTAALVLTCIAVIVPGNSRDP